VNGAGRRVRLPVSRERRGLAAALALVCSAACSPTLDWRDFSWPEGGFGVLMPAKPSEETRAVSIGPAHLNLHLFSASAGGNAYAAGYADIPATIDTAARERLLDDAQAAFARNVGAAAAPPARNQLAGFPCRQFGVTGTSKGHEIRLAGRVCATDRRFYQLVYIGPADREREADIGLFLGSLKLLQ
jgi:hypothetical protein